MADTIGQDANGPVRPVYKGRATVYSRFDEICEDNVVQALEEALPCFRANSAQIQYLWSYYKGVQPILGREKKVREDINNTVVENHAQEVVAFKIGYQLAEPLQYTCRMQESDDDSDASYDDTLKQVNELNTLMFAEDKASCDRDLFEWMAVGGIGFRMCEADSAADAEDGGAPFEIYTLDPRRTFVVRSRSYHHRVVMSVWAGIDSDDDEVYNVYTDEMWFLVKNGSVRDRGPITYGANPIVEYQLNNARMGVFEPVLGLLDAINVIESNRLDDIEQTVQALMKFVNCEVDKDEFLEMLDLGAVKVKTIDPQFKSDIDVIKTDLDQTGAQVAKEDLYQSVVNICGMPNRNGQGGSTSDTGAAVLLRDGWTLAESHAKSYELQFKRAERDFLRVALSICRQSADCAIDLRIRDIELAFNRRNYENILVKSQVLTTMLESEKVHPQLAFQACGLFTDPDAAYRQSQEYADERGTDLAAAAMAVASEQTVARTVAAGPQAGVPEPEEGEIAPVA
ncbi:phage portal protein [Adlercreutzia sp. R25]|uniref:phage portal protein n=1 Tax=Adlercreutzia shanghongiae TaxID=3111773 RepID=UPI002DB9F059|nr:phage portal protein [Adlercreutzia sp. R25]MEC4272954.1 phage portal protein [Adlercreutzia sp. R25]